MRLDVRLAEQTPDVSRATWQKYIKAGHVSVNGRIINVPKYDVNGDDTIVTDIPKQDSFADNALPVIYQDSNVIVVNKPSGVLSHSKGALNNEFTVATFLARFSTYNTDTNRPGIVHRLDRDTSGVMIGALNDTTARLLQKQFASRKVYKTYVAVVQGQPNMPEAMIDLPIGRNPKHPSQFRVDPNGKTAQTTYKVLATGQNYSLVELMPRTGRTHQLRVHMAHIGNPIVGDRVYGKPADRLYLHAAKLEITIPDGQRMIFAANVPPEFENMEQK